MQNYSLVVLCMTLVQSIDIAAKFRQADPNLRSASLSYSMVGEIISMSYAKHICVYTWINETWTWDQDTGACGPMTQTRPRRPPGPWSRAHGMGLAHVIGNAIGHIHFYICLYIYMQRETEREREYIHIYIYIYTHM